MKSVVAYIRSLFGWVDGNPDLPSSYKRDRADDEFSSDDDIPTAKRLKNFRTTTFPNYVTLNDTRDSQDTQYQKVRYVPIQRENRQASTSTPLEMSTHTNRVCATPLRLVSTKESGPDTPFRKPRMHTPVRPDLHAVVDDEDETEIEWVKAKTDKQETKQPKLYINLDEEDVQQDENMIFLKKATSPVTHKPYKLFITDSNNEVVDLTEDEVYCRIKRSVDKNKGSPRAYSKFNLPPGITKTYKRPAPSIPKWMQTMESSNSRNRSSKPNYSFQNGNTRSTMFEVFNLNEKKNYRDLIKKVTESMNPSSSKKSNDFVNLVGDAASFRITQREQKQSLKEINLVEKRVAEEKKDELNTEYDPITVASINSSDSDIEVLSSKASTSSSARIDPVNTLRESFKQNQFVSNDFITKLNSKYRQKKLETQEKLKDARREFDIISKVICEQKIAHLEYKLKHELSIPESILEEPQPTVELPKLTAEQEKLVNRALGPGPAGQVLVEKFNLKITRRDLQTLSGLNWLNDEVINFYMNLLMQRSDERKDMPKVYATNTFFYPRLMQSGQTALRRWTKKIDVFAHDLMVVPVHLGVHWCLSLVDFREKKVSYLDSMGGRNQACLDALLQYLRDEHHDKKGKPFDDQGWKTECLSKDIPQQMNGSDCGMFACTFAEFSSRNAPYTFSQVHMPYLRRKAALEILTGKLLL